MIDTPGALQGMPVGMLDPRYAALLQTGLGMMSQAGPSPMPVSFGQALGRAGQQGMQTYAQTQQGNMQQMLMRMQMEQAQRTAAQDAAKREALGRLSQDPRFAGLSDLMMLDPKAAIGQAFPEPKVVGPGGSLVQPGQQQPLFQAPFKPDTKESPLAALMRERDALPPDDPRRASYDEAIKKSTTHQPPIANIDMRQDTEFSKVVGKEMGEQYSGLMKADMNAPSTIAKYQRLGDLLKQVNTGKFKGTTTNLKSYAKSLGVDLTALGVSDDVAPAQAAIALSNQIALELRNPAGGAGMPGALSDKDREFLIQSIPSLENDPGAIGKMIEYRVKLAKREQQVAKLARDYRKKHGKFDDGFYNELQEWSDRNQLFGGESTAPRVRRYNPATGKIE